MSHENHHENDHNCEHGHSHENGHCHSCANGDSHDLCHATPDPEEALRAAGVRVTAVRLLIWRTLTTEITGAFSLSDVQDRLYTVDKSTLFRALTLFAESGLLHLIDDGSGMQKYCVCRCGHPADHPDHPGHVHLSCTVCHKTWCVEDIQIPPVTLPPSFAGFSITEREYIIKGICPKCRREQRLHGH